MSLPSWFINTPKQHGHPTAGAPTTTGPEPRWRRPRKPGRQVRRRQEARIARLKKGLTR